MVTVQRRPWRHLLVLTADNDLQLTTRQVSCHSVVFNSGEHGAICTYKLRFADSIDFCYNLKRTAAESHRMLVEVYGDHVLGKSNHSAMSGL